MKLLQKETLVSFKTTTKNFPCSANPKTSMLAALSAIKLLKSFNESITVGL